MNKSHSLLYFTLLYFTLLYSTLLRLTFFSVFSCHPILSTHLAGLLTRLLTLLNHPEHINERMREQVGRSTDVTDILHIYIYMYIHILAK